MISAAPVMMRAVEVINLALKFLDAATIRRAGQLEPGQRSDVHEHELDYIMIQISGDTMSAEMEPDSGGPWGHLGTVEGDVFPGNVLYAERGGIESAVNNGKVPFHEIVVELKD